MTYSDLLVLKPIISSISGRYSYQTHRAFRPSLLIILSIYLHRRLTWEDFTAEVLYS